MIHVSSTAGHYWLLLWLARCDPGGGRLLISTNCRYTAARSDSRVMDSESSAAALLVMKGWIVIHDFLLALLAGARQHSSQHSRDINTEGQRITMLENTTAY